MSRQMRVEVEAPGTPVGRAASVMPLDHVGGERERAPRRASSARDSRTPAQPRDAGREPRRERRQHAKTPPPSGSVPYVLTRPSEFAFASWRRGTRFGSDASRAGVHSSDRHSITNDSSEDREERRRGTASARTSRRADVGGDHDRACGRVRSTRAPANGPNRIAGSMRAVMTAATAQRGGGGGRASLRDERGHRDEPDPVAERGDRHRAPSRRENAGWVRRSLKVAARVPRSAATSSAKLDTTGLALARRRPRWAQRRAAVRGSSAAGAFFAAAFFRSSRPVFFFAAGFFAVVFSFALPRARRARHAWPRARAAASASGSPDLVTLNSRSSSAPQFQQRQRLRTLEQQRAALGARMVLLGRVADREVALRVAVRS